jgi:hypothetical protein
MEGISEGRTGMIYTSSERSGTYENGENQRIKHL